MSVTFSVISVFYCYTYFFNEKYSKEIFIWPWHTTPHSQETGRSTWDTENPGGQQISRRLKETADKIKQKPSELYVSSRPPQKQHFERLGNYIIEAFSLTFVFVSSNFVTFH